MEEKYCERCGAFLGFVNPCKKYCKECKIIVRKERQALEKQWLWMQGVVLISKGEA